MAKTIYFSIVILTIIIFVKGKARLSLSIQAYKPRGLEISIPPGGGVHLFAFHGNINEPIERPSSGKISGETSRRILEFPEIKLKIGDKIYYWAFISAKNGVGYVMEGVFEVTDVKQIVGPDGETTSTETSTRRSPNCDSLLILNLTQTVIDLEKKNDFLTKVNLIVRDLVGKHYDTSTILTLKGPLPEGQDLQTLVEAVIKDKLNLGIRPQNIQRKSSDEAEFRVATLDDKISIIIAGAEKLKNSAYSIEY